ncbi:unnamed protein product [Phytomonas sp. EM1]|nr:unnamed protein product [Phytomonas sp. EM1]|eukprot:CCW65387.1 unnamed protein product [Phytomonas sp. isolate EM1]
MESFFGVEVMVGKPLKPKIPDDRVLHVSQIALPAGARDAVTFRVVLDRKSFTVATLDPKRGVYFTRLDFVFSPTQKVLFAADGPLDSSSVHVTGFTQLSEDIEEDEEDLVDESDEVPKAKSLIYGKKDTTEEEKQLKAVTSDDGKSNRKRKRH